MAWCLPGEQLGIVVRPTLYRQGAWTVAKLFRVNGAALVGLMFLPRTPKRSLREVYNKKERGEIEMGATRVRESANRRKRRRKILRMTEEISKGKTKKKRTKAVTPPRQQMWERRSGVEVILGEISKKGGVLSFRLQVV